MKKILVVVCSLLLALSVFVLEVSSQASGDACKGRVGNFVYDLTGLKDATKGADQQTRDAGGNTYYYRPCQVLQETQCAIASDPSPAVCQKDTRKIPQFHDCGSMNQVSWSARSQGENTGFKIQFKGGEEDRMSDVEFVCDHNANPGTFVTASPAENPTHFYHLIYTTKFACPQGGDGGDGGGGGGGDGGDDGGISGGWIFIIILICLTVVYLVGGVLWNRFRRDLRGLEMIPNYHFWVALPGLVIAGNIYLWRKARGLCGASYDTV